MRIRFLIAAALVSALAMSAADTKSLPWEKTKTRIAQGAYRTSCGTCHDVDKAQDQTKKMGPSLQGVFKTGKFPVSGDPMTRATLKDKIKQGGVIMPGFDGILNDREIDLIIDFVQSK